MWIVYEPDKFNRGLVFPPRRILLWHSVDSLVMVYGWYGVYAIYSQPHSECAQTKKKQS